MFKAYLRFYAQLNDFLPAKKKQSLIEYKFKDKVTVKHAIEAIGIPHVEVDLILANCSSVNFNYLLKDKDYLSFYPTFFSIDIKEITEVPVNNAKLLRFVADIHLGSLTKYLRMMGFDTLYSNSLHDNEIAQISEKEKRIILTRDIGLLKRKNIYGGYFIRSNDPEKQIKEVLNRFDLYNSIDLFKHCLLCNGNLITIAKSEIIDKLLPKTKLYYDDFKKCNSCQKIFWQGSHYEKMRKFIEQNIRNF